MFKKILIANRGEIACRIMRTAARMGIATVAVHSEADRDAPHVAMADEAVEIGPAPAADSYLSAEKIIGAAQATGAEAVHPGYGFLSENAAFAEACAEAGLVFIGPRAEAIRAMGDKIESKRRAGEAGVSVIPGFMGEIPDADEAVRVAEEIGYPVMIKASAGGGGKGMRIACNAQETREGFAAARSEALSAFGDGRILIEKYIENPRHVEIQVMGDRHGNVIFLGERECSIQRRNQKIVEEAPSPLLDEETRARMGAQACALARAVGYDSAGTVEFVAGQDRSFFFLEMNTRLQVEHPVTEMVTGLDLVEMMIRSAAGEPLPLRQEDVKLNGWAVETRLYAEDPFRGFLPSTGRLRRFSPPREKEAETARVRVDTGVAEGGEISVHYDPMIAKLITWGADRQTAIRAQADALDAFHIAGIRHNVPFLSAVMASGRFRRGALSTGFVEEEFPDGFSGAPETEAVLRRIMAAAAAMDHLENARWRAAFPLAGDGGSPRVVWRRQARRGVSVRVEEAEDGALDVFFDDAGGRLRVEQDWRPGQPVWRGRMDGRALSMQVERAGDGYRLTHRGVGVDLCVCSVREAQMAALMPAQETADVSRRLICPMPGKVLAVPVRAGQEVKAGEPLCVVEAMKMENILRAERDLVVSVIRAEVGQTVAVDQILMEFAEDAAGSSQTDSA